LSLGAVAASVLYPIARFLDPPERSHAVAANQIEAGLTNDADYIDKGYKIVRFGDKPVIVVRVEEGDFRAFSAVCTHLDCIVEYRKNKRVIWCNCHNGQYDLQGGVLAGPPPKPLTSYDVKLVDAGDQQRKVVVTRS
jgi:cytochrome b6-f complex iron-sulfur subunit